MSGLFYFWAMQSFLEQVAQKVRSSKLPLDKTVFVLPSKRAGTFLKTILAKTANATFFSPDIYSIEGFVEEISELSFASHTKQLFTLYEAYLEQTWERKDDFFAFSKWASTLLQDFNEIDRYLIESNSLFGNLAAIQELNHWSLQAEKTEMMKDYLSFWNNLDKLYNRFNDKLLSSDLGHQGLVYRIACQKLSWYLESNADSHFIFIGFNALNTAESTIIQEVLKKAQARIYWDLDSYFLSDEIHDAGLFIRQHKKEWSYFEHNELKGISSNYLQNKAIKVIGVPKNISQAKYVGQLLYEIQSGTSIDLKKTAVVLGDESLMNPLLNSIPEEISRVNITMGYPLVQTPMASLFDQYLNLYLNRTDQGWFHRLLESFLSHPYIQLTLDFEEENKVNSLLSYLKTNNYSYIGSQNLRDLVNSDLSEILFLDNTPTPIQWIENCQALILQMKVVLQQKNDSLGLEYLYRFHRVFNQLRDVIKDHQFVNDLKSLQSLFREVVGAESLDFQGEPLEGLQIMGMLESRNLDYETVIITSVNEGILPSGKSNNSFIPFDLKVRLGLPTYKEKDAVYTYHFYRLLQRAKNIFILYNTEPDVLEGGERSRLIHQLLTDVNMKPFITESIAAPIIQPQVKKEEKVIKDQHLLKLIKEHAIKGFSPTSLTNYIRNPIDFYKRNLLGIDDVLEVEETIAANTFGTVVHDTLEELYTPFIGSNLSIDKLNGLKNSIYGTVQKHFSNSYLGGDISTGRNLIAFNVVVRYVENFIAMEIAELEHHEIKILGLEKSMKTILEIPGIDFPVALKGKLDRIDEMDGVICIIDYKTGKVVPSQVEIVEWEEIILDYKYSKAFQLLCYALMFHKTEGINNLESGIVSFKNLGAGLMSFATKESSRSRTKNREINLETLGIFQEHLAILIREICHPEIPLLEKQV